jgi:hypothetical protein
MQQSYTAEPIRKGPRMRAESFESRRLREEEKRTKEQQRANERLRKTLER